jgi:hypothetical protein
MAIAALLFRLYHSSMLTQQLCLLPADFLPACSQVAYYCCKQHQSRHWRQHKEVCSHLKQLGRDAAQGAAAAATHGAAAAPGHTAKQLIYTSAYAVARLGVSDNISDRRFCFCNWMWIFTLGSRRHVACWAPASSGGWCPVTKGSWIVSLYCCKSGAADALVTSGLLWPNLSLLFALCVCVLNNP